MRSLTFLVAGLIVVCMPAVKAANLGPTAGKKPVGAAESGVLPPLRHAPTVPMLSGLPSPVTTALLVYHGVELSATVTTASLRYVGVAIPNHFTTPSLQYVGIVIPNHIDTPSLRYNGRQALRMPPVLLHH